MIPNDTIHRLSEKAGARGKTVAELVAEAIAHYVDHLDQTGD